MPRKTKLIISYIALALWAVVIFYLSSEGHDVSSGRSDEIVATLQSLGTSVPSDTLSFIVRKSAHTIAYFIFGLLAFNVMRFYKLPASRAVLAAMLIVIVYAASDELHQYFVPGRSSEPRDVLIDTTAGLIGVSILAFINARRSTKRLNKIGK